MFMYIYVYIHIYQHIHTYIYKDFIIYTYWVYLWKYIYVYTYIQMIPIKRTTYFHLLQYLKRKKMYFQNVKSISNLCRSWRRLCTVHIIQIYYTLHTMIHVKVLLKKISYFWDMTFWHPRAFNRIIVDCSSTMSYSRKSY